MGRAERPTRFRHYAKAQKLGTTAAAGYWLATASIASIPPTRSAFFS